MLIFKARLTSERQKGTLYAFAVDLQGRCDWRVMTNELEGALVEGWPEIGEGLRNLRSSHPTPVSLSGSGAASFAVFDNPEAARRAAAELPADLFVHVGTTLRRRSARLTVRAASDGGRG
jgi:4-diphosphocytidyl-2C-methyl-D-erythritol kinase